MLTCRGRAQLRLLVTYTKHSRGSPGLCPENAALARRLTTSALPVGANAFRSQAGEGERTCLPWAGGLPTWQSPTGGRILMRLIERYIFKIAAAAFVACLLALTGVIWITQALR